MLFNKFFRCKKSKFDLNASQFFYEFYNCKYLNKNAEI